MRDYGKPPEQIIVRLPYTPYPWQKDLHDNQKKRKVLNIHRQAGKTSWAVAEIIKKSIETVGLYWYVAPTYNAAYDIAWKKFEEMLPSQIVRKVHKNRLEIWLINGSIIQLKGCEDPDKLRGRTLQGIVIDEFAAISKQKELWEEVLEPTLLRTKGWVVFLSTPQGKNYFWLMSKEAESNDNWYYKKLTVNDTGVLSKDEVNQIRSEKDKNAFDQEYMCDFLEGEGLVFRNLNACFGDCLSGKLRGHHYQMGVDLARKTDYTVITVVDKSNLNIVYIERFNQLDWPLQKSKIEAIYRKYDVDKAIMDATGIGDPIIQDLEREGLYIEPFQYTNISKKQLIEHLSILIEQQRVKLPEFPELMKELQIFGFEKTESGNTRYEAPHGFHDDCVNSLALCLWNLSVREDTRGVYNSYDENLTAYKFDY